MNQDLFGLHQFSSPRKNGLYKCRLIHMLGRKQFATAANDLARVEWVASDILLL